MLQANGSHTTDILFCSLMAVTLLISYTETNGKQKKDIRCFRLMKPTECASNLAD
jgi:hypothetical protein